MAERLFKARVRPDAPVVATSAGTAAVVGHGMDGPSAIALLELGGVPDGHFGRRVTTELVHDSDLVLTAESAHRSIIVSAHPLRFRKCFTMREFARLGAGLDSMAAPLTVDALRARVAEVADQRGQSDTAVGPAQDDIGDPYGAPLEVARARASQVAEAVDALIEVLGLARGPGHDPSRAASSAAHDRMPE
jgi:protein-tyrosine-phosphatase